MSLLSRNNTAIYFIAALLSILLSYDGSLRATVVNPDGICYLQSAATIASAGLHTATQLCGQAQWPFYSILIYSVVSLTKFSYITAAFVVDGICSLISVLTFIYIVQLMGAPRRVLWLAAATILMAHEFNSVREYVIRDHGFWAFYLISVVGLIKFFRHDRWCDALLWLSALSVATLFRVEGIIFIIMLPFTALFVSKNRLRLFLQLNTITILVGLSVVVYVFVHHGALQEGRFGEIQYQFLHGIQGIVANFHAKADALGKSVLSVYSARDAGIILFLLLLVWYGFSVVANVSVIYACLIIYAWWNKLVKLDKPVRLVLFGYIIVNIIITAAFLVDFMFLSKRYLMALSLLLMLWVPFAIESIIQQYPKRRWVFIATVFFMLTSALGGIVDFGYSKTYIRDAGLWLAQNVPINATIYSNDYQVMFYSNHFGNDIFAKAGEFSDMTSLANNKWHQYNFLALRVNRRDFTTNKVIQEIAAHTTFLHEFANKRGDEVIIYKVSR